MMRRYVAGLIAILAFFAASHATLRAQSPPSTATYLSLLSQGFEVKSVLISNGINTPQEERDVVVTLQNGDVTKRCWITWSTYATGNARDSRGQLLPMNCY